MFSIRTLVNQAISSFLVFNLHKSGLNIFISTCEKVKGALQYPDPAEFQWKLLMWKIPRELIFTFFLVAFALPEGAVLEVT